MSDSELQEVVAVATALQSQRGGRAGAFNSATDAIPGLLFDALQAICGGLGAHWATVALTKHGKLLTKRAPAVVKFFKAHFNGWDENKVVQLAFMKMMFELLADDLKERGVQPTFGIMVVNLNRLPEVFENAFPDYLANRMGHVVLKTITSSRLG